VTSAIRHVAVVGAGTMGSGIAQVAAALLGDVTLHDTSELALSRALASIDRSLAKFVEKGLLSESQRASVKQRIRLATSLDEAAEADLVIEAVVEDEAVKCELFSALDRIAAPGTVLASNTSSIPISRLAAATNRPDRVAGMHFMNPVPLMPLVEIIRGPLTSEKTMAIVKTFVTSMNKTGVESADRPGFIANRVLMPMINEAAFALAEGVGTREAIDQVMKIGMNHPMGPLALADLIGLDVCLAILRVLERGLGSAKYRPCPLFEELVAAGRLGRKSGRGFYEYS
jgi:3-hydroxybutyryl-CoA dehydrogenase